MSDPTDELVQLDTTIAHYRDELVWLSYVILGPVDKPVASDPPGRA